MELQRVLPGISTEQLRSRLNRMVADGMLTRKRYREVPPRVDYALTERAYELLPVLGELARWAYEWAWSTPRPTEEIDLGAIFRIAPGLVRLDAATGGTVELTVNDGKPDGGPASYALTCSAGAVSIQEREAPDADARVSGARSAWIAALSPGIDRTELEIVGARELAELLLDGLAGRSPAGAGAATAVA